MLNFSLPELLKQKQLVNTKETKFFIFFSIPLPPWVLEEMSKNPDLVYTDRSGRRNPEYISLGCDSLPVLRGRTPIQVYSDYMRSFRERFQDYLGNVIEVKNNLYLVRDSLAF